MVQEIRAIEIGCAAGKNSLDILEKLKISELVLIDPYDIVPGNYDDYTVERLKLMREQSKKRLSKFEDKITWIKKTSLDARRTARKYDFIYVDGTIHFSTLMTTLKTIFRYCQMTSCLVVTTSCKTEFQAICQLIKEGKIDMVSLNDPDWIITS